MFSREVTNDYGSYSKQSPTTILFKGVFDKNFKELTTIDPNTETYKVFNCPSQSINFAVKLGSNTYIPQHLFDTLVTAYNENNPYYTVKDLITIEMDLSKTIAYIEGKYGAKVETNSITYFGTEKIIDVTNNQTSTATITTQSGSVNVTTPAVLNTATQTTASIIEINATKIQGISSRLELGGVTNLQFQFYNNNIPTSINEENIIKHILFIFDETNVRVSGNYTTLPYQNADGSVILSNLPASTDVVKPVTQRVTNLDDYLKDVQRT